MQIRIKLTPNETLSVYNISNLNLEGFANNLNTCYLGHNTGEPAEGAANAFESVASRGLRTRAGAAGGALAQLPHRQHDRLLQQLHQEGHQLRGLRGRRRRRGRGGGG